MPRPDPLESARQRLARLNTQGPAAPPSTDATDASLRILRSHLLELRDELARAQLPKDAEGEADQADRG